MQLYARMDVCTKINTHVMLCKSTMDDSYKTELYMINIILCSIHLEVLHRNALLNVVVYGPPPHGGATRQTMFSIHNTLW